MYRCWIAVLVIAACGSERTAVTRKVTTLGYAKPPAIAIVAQGERDVVDPWAASLRASGIANVVVELPQAPSPFEVTYEARQLCATARDAVKDGPALDEIVIINSYVWPVTHDKCIDEDCKLGPLFAKNDPLVKDCTCVTSRYSGVTVRIETNVAVLRAESCDTVRTEKLRPVIGESSKRDPIEYALAGDAAEMHAAKSYDEAEAKKAAIAAVAATAPHQTWPRFPVTSPILSVERPTVIIGSDAKAPMSPDKTYFLKPLLSKILRPGVRVVRADAVTTTLELDKKLPDPAAGDELHVTVDMRKQSLYGLFGGGIVKAQSETHGSASAALAFRIAFDRIPVMAEVQLGGDLIPGLDARRWNFGGAAGLRWPRGPVSPVVFGELGVATAYQSFNFAEAFGGYAGVGIGAELWLRRWFVFADVRRRWFVMDEWKHGDALVNVPYPDLTWISTTGQIGVGRNF